MKKYRLLLYSLISLSFLVTACKQNEELIQKKGAKSSSITNLTSENAMHWYREKRTELRLRTGSSGKVMNLNQTTTNSSSDPFYIGEPNWLASASYQLSPTITLIKVPLTNYEVNRSWSPNMTPTGYRELVFQRDPAGAVTSLVIEYHPDMSYLIQSLAQHPTASIDDYGMLVQSATYTGFILTFDLNNLLLSGHHRTNGVPDITLDVSTLYN